MSKHASNNSSSPKGKGTYKKSEEWCEHVIKKGHDLFFSTDTFDADMMKVSRDLKFPLESLNSLLRNIHLLYVKKRSYAIRKQMNSHVLVEYMQGSSIRQLAKHYNFPPSLLARGIVENITIYEKKEITKAMRDPLAKLCTVDVILEKYRDSENANVVNTNTNDGEIPSALVSPIVDPFSGRPMPGSDTCTRLAREVLEAINSDPLYGPRFDKERNYVGIEYEMKLERALRTMNIPFETEEQLRLRGTPRTPDILFSCPVAIKVPKRILQSSGGSAENAITNSRDDDDYVWKMICWVDSKAMFGDVKMHQTSVLPQAETYVHRFGPGLILYWFGHAPIEMLGTGHGDVFVIGWDIPKLFMMPTGKLARDGL